MSKPQYAILRFAKYKGPEIGSPGLCLKTIVHGSYSQLPSVYAKQIRWAEENHYENSKPLYEVY